MRDLGLMEAPESKNAGKRAGVPGKKAQCCPIRIMEDR